MRDLKLAGIGRYVAPLAVKGATPDMVLIIRLKSMNYGVMTAGFFPIRAVESGP
jgi:hypothetical protein